MPALLTRTGAATLRPYWKQWSRAIAGYALRRGSRLRPDAHANLHRRVLATCHALATASLGEEKEFYEYLEGLVRPWSAPETLTRTDRDLLLDLMFQCQEAERRLEGSKDRIQKLGRILNRFLVVVVATFVVAFLSLVLLTALSSPRDTLGWIVSRTDHLWHSTSGFSSTEKMLLGGAVLTVGALAIVARSARR